MPSASAIRTMMPQALSGVEGLPALGLNELVATGNKKG